MIDLEGFFTNDEGRLGDDEKEESSFECDVRVNPWWDERTTSDVEEEKFQKIVNGVMDEYRAPFVFGVEGKSGLGTVFWVWFGHTSLLCRGSWKNEWRRGEHGD